MNNGKIILLVFLQECRGGSILPSLRREFPGDDAWIFHTHEHWRFAKQTTKRATACFAMMNELSMAWSPLSLSPSPSRSCKCFRNWFFRTGSQVDGDTFISTHNSRFRSRSKSSKANKKDDWGREREERFCWFRLNKKMWRRWWDCDGSRDFERWAEWAIGSLKVLVVVAAVGA